jgi:hypothetical protein
MRMFSLGLAVLAAFGLAAPLVSGADNFKDLLPLIPEETNYLVMIDVQGLRQSPLGTKNDWARRHLGAT